MTNLYVIFENKEPKIRFHYHNNISLTWGLIIINFIKKKLLIFVLFLFFYFFIFLIQLMISWAVFLIT